MKSFEGALTSGSYLTLLASSIIFLKYNGLRLPNIPKKKSLSGILFEFYSKSGR